MSPRTGRPKSDNPKGDFVGVRLDKLTVEKLDEVVKLKSPIVRKSFEKELSLFIRTQKNRITGAILADEPEIL